MPLYEYACLQCQHQFDIRHGANEKPELCCPKCQGAVKKVFHAAGIIFKGSGWYVTDNAPKDVKPLTETSESTKREPVTETKSEALEKKSDTPEKKADTPSAEVCATPA